MAPKKIHHTLNDRLVEFPKNINSSESDGVSFCFSVSASLSYVAVTTATKITIRT